MPLLDAWTNTFRSLGSRTTGQGAQKYVLLNQAWGGETPEGYEVIVSPTNMVWITGRIQADDPQDAVAAGLLQDAYKLLTVQKAKGDGDPFEGFEPTYYCQRGQKAGTLLTTNVPRRFLQRVFPHVGNEPLTPGRWTNARDTCEGWNRARWRVGT